MNLLYNVIHKMIGVSKAQRNFMVLLMETLFSMSGRANFSNMARYAECDEKTFSRNFAKSFDFVQCSTLAIQEVVEPQKLHALAFDQVFIPKSGKMTWSRDFFWNGSHSRSEKGIEATGFALVDVASRIAYPVCAIQTPPHTEIAQLINTPDATRMDFYVHIIKETAVQVIKSFPFVKHLVGDAANANSKVVTGVLEIGLHLVSKLRSDASLKSLEFEEREGSGRPRKSGAKIDVTKDDEFTYVGEVIIENNNEKPSKKPKKKANLHTIICYNVNLKRNIQVVRLTFKKSFILLFSTDLELSSENIVEIYRSRFQIEFIFRDAKQYTGLTQCQARSKEKIHFHINASFLAILLARVEEAKEHQAGITKKSFSMENHKRRKHNEMHLNRISSMFEINQSSIYYEQRRKEVLELGIISY